MRRVILMSLLGAALWFGGQGGYIYAKAWLAQQLIAYSWQETLQTHQPVKPWSWADTWPVGRLRVPSHAVDLFVLAGDSGNSLAFGPGLRPGSPLISAHRDTHFRFLKTLRAGDAVLWQDMSGRWRRYVVTNGAVVHESVPLLQDLDPTMLVLLTCYPFDAITPGGPWRYVVFARVTAGVLI